MSNSPLKYHEGEVAVQQRAGVFDPADFDGNGLGTELDARIASFLTKQPWAIIAAIDDTGSVWTSLFHGPPGFLQANDPETLTVQASLPAGDPLRESLQHSTQIGMLLLDPQNRRRVRINGRVEPGRDGTLLVKVREAFGNCPKYIQRRQISGEVPPGDKESILSPALAAEHREWIVRADTFFIGSVHAQAGVDCSHRGGNPGFVRVLNARTLAFPDYSGNNMFQTLGNLSLDSRAGLLFLDFESGDTLQLTGHATVSWDTARFQDWPGAHRVIEFEIRKVLARESAFPLRWRLLEFSSFNPGPNSGERPAP